MKRLQFGQVKLKVESGLALKAFHHTPATVDPAAHTVWQRVLAVAKCCEHFQFEHNIDNVGFVRWARHTTRISHIGGDAVRGGGGHKLV